MCTAVGLALAVGSALPAAAPAQDALEAGPDPDRPWAAEADALLRDGDFDAARRAYRELMAGHEDDWGLWLRMSLVELQLGNPGAAVDAAEKAVERADGDLDPYFMLSEVRAVVGDGDGAMAALRTALELQPGNLEVLQTLATLAIELQRWGDAVGLLRELIRLEPDRADYRLDVGKIMLTQGAFDEAIAQFEEAAEKGADRAEARALVGKAQLAAGRRAEALATFEASNAIRPNGDAWGGLATLHSIDGRAREAVTAFRRAIEFSPDDPDLHFNLGNVLSQTDQLEEAEAAYRRALELEPDSALTRTNLAVLLLNRFEFAEAEQHLRLAARLDPQRPSPHLHLGRIASARYAYEEALQHYRRYRALLRDPERVRQVDAEIARLQTKVATSKAAVAQGKVHLLQIVVDTEAEARDVLARLRRGEDFYVLAHMASRIAETAGVDVGFIEVDSIQPAIREHVGKLAVGQYTEPIRTEAGFHLFKRVE